MDNTMKLRAKSWTIVMALAICTTAAFAQDQKQDNPPADANPPLQPLNTNPNGGYSNPPIGAARGLSGPDNSQPYDPSQATPDPNTLAGATPFTLGSLQRPGNIFDPAIMVSELGVSYPSTTGPATVSAETVLGGSLRLDRIWGRNDFSVLYHGSETFNYGFGSASNPFGGGSQNYPFHDLVVTQEGDWGRWRVVLKDEFTAAPGATFGGQGIGGPGLAAQISSQLGSSLSSFAGTTVAGQTIDTGFGMRYMNSILGQVGYSFSRRSTFTVSGSYGLLHFAGDGYINSNMVNAQAGYDYELDPANSIAVIGSYGKITYPGTGNITTDYVGALAYGRKITGRLAFHISAGPQEIRSSGSAGTGNFNQLFVSVNTALTYQRRRTGLSLGYTRGLSGGSGVLEGATSNTFSATVNYKITQFWTWTINGGYATNTSLAPVGATTLKFDNWFVGTNVGRQIGRHAQINFNYGAIEQNTPASCPVASCGIPGLQQTFGMTFNWHLLPVSVSSR
jgi:hypothetical protein